MIKRFLNSLKLYRLKLAITFFHSVFMLLLTLLWMNSPLVYEDEYFLVRILTLAKKVILNSESKPDPEKFLFINVAYNKELIPHYGEAGEELGDEIITDRNVLANILKNVNECNQNPKMVVLDVVLESPSQNDSILEYYAQKLGNKFIVSANENEGKVIAPIIDVPYGLASYTTVQEGLLGVTSDAFFKYQPLKDTDTKNISVKVFENVYKTKIESGLLWNKENGDFLFKSFIIDQPIRYYDLFLAPQEKRYPMLYANDFNVLPKEIIQELIKNRLVYVGDFELSDMHETIYGQTPGSLILANQLIALEREEHKIPFLWLIFMVFSFGVLTYEAFWQKNVIQIAIFKFLRIKSIARQNNIQSFVKILGSVSLVAILSYFIFDISIGILFLVLYFQLIKFLRKAYRFLKLKFL